MDSKLKKKTFVFYPEFSGMVGSTTLMSALLIVGACLVFTQEIFGNPKSGLLVSDIIMYVLGGLCFIAALFVYVFKRLYINSTKYFLTETKLVIESGVVKKKVSELALSNIIDLELEQSIIQNFFNGCTLIIYSTDATDPVLEISDLNIVNAKNIFKLLGYFVELNKPEIVPVDNENEDSIDGKKVKTGDREGVVAEEEPLENLFSAGYNLRDENPFSVDSDSPDDDSPSKDNNLLDDNPFSTGYGSTSNNVAF
jgi:hypothetical protein